MPRASSVKLNRLRSGVGRFCFSMYKRGFASYSQTVSVVPPNRPLITFSYNALHVQTPQGISALMVLDVVKQDVSFILSLSESDPGSVEAEGGKKMDPRPRTCLICCGRDIPTPHKEKDQY